MESLRWPEVGSGDERGRCGAEVASAKPPVQRAWRRLQERAHDARVTVPRLLVEEALADQIGQTATARHDLAVALFGAFRLLSSIANNVNQIAKATNPDGEW